MKIWKVLPALILLLAPVVMRAQFYVTGDNPASVRWYSTQTAHYKIVYPAGLDSLARAYGRSLEQYLPVVGTSVGFEPGQYTRGRIPVILHAYDAVSNGSVAWAPKRVDLFTSPDPFSSEPFPWIENLTIHEQRHVAQMQLGLSKVFRPFGYIFGEMFNGLVAGIYLAHREGDAVVMETALSRSGRGRTADFMNYYMIAFDNDDKRSTYQWRLGSQRRYTLNTYAYGYLSVAGARQIYDDSDLIARYYDLVSRRPLNFDGLNIVLNRDWGIHGKRLFYNTIDMLKQSWREEIASRAPYTPADIVTAHEKMYVDFSHGTVLGGDIYAVRQGIARPYELVRVSPDGTERTVRAFASVSSKLAAVPGTGRIYWSEYGYDPRWSMRVNSIVRYYDTGLGKMKTVTRKGRLFSPAASEDGNLLSVTHYYDDGRTGVTVLDPDSGEKIASRMAPDTLQIMESAWVGDRIYVAAISSEGSGIYSIGFSRRPEDGGAPAGMAAENEAGGSENARAFRFTGDWTMDMKPEPAMLDGLRSHLGKLYFTSDRTGVRELFRLDSSNGNLYRVTSTKYGADDFSFTEHGDTLYYSLKQYDGNYIVAAPADSLLSVPTDPDDLYEWKMADEMSRQEAVLARKKFAAAGITDAYKVKVGSKKNPSWLMTANPDTVSFTEPKRYYKGGHLFTVHSWAPVYFNVDNIMSLSFDHIYDLVSLGLSAVSQNQLSTAVSQLGYSAHKDPYDKSKWRHSGHLDFTYTGWYPVIEAKVDFNDRSAMDHAYTTYMQNGVNTFVATSQQLRDKPYITGTLSVYIPFDFTRGGWSTGFIPQLNYTVSNDSLTKTVMTINGATPQDDGYEFTRKDVVILQRLSASARAYTMRPVPKSGVYPRWGVGAQVGASFRPGLRDYYSPMTYFYLYGYLPGLYLTHGLSLSYTVQGKLRDESILGDSMVTILPRGMSSNSTLASYAAWYSRCAMKFSADYAMPINTGDVCLGGYLFYFSRLILTPHFDYTLFDWNPNYIFNGDLWSVGASLAVDFKSLFWIKVPISIGVTFSYNGGTAFPSLSSVGLDMSRYYVGPMFSITI